MRPGAVGWKAIRGLVPTFPETTVAPRKIMVLNRDDLSSRMRRPRAYISKLPPAVAGQHGHDATFQVACECVRFGLTDGEALDVIAQYSTRCIPPWSDKELNHKVAQARRKASAGERLAGLDAYT